MGECSKLCVCVCMRVCDVLHRQGSCLAIVLRHPSKVSEQANKQAGVTNVCMYVCVACVAVWKDGEALKFPLNNLFFAQ